MCNVCGCNDSHGAAIVTDHDEAVSRGEPPHGHHDHHPQRSLHVDHAPERGHDHEHDHEHLDFGSGPARAHAPGLTQTQMIRIEQDILGKNAAFAAANRREFARRALLAINLLSGPGAGKTTLVVRTLEMVRDRFPVVVIEGDQQTSIDADRIRAAGARAVQINTGKGCHLDAHMVEHAVESLRPQRGSLLIIENVGNLVCPAAFDLGESHTVVLLSVTEGDDKPLKYPDIFRSADLMLVSKCDLLPHVDFNVERVVENAARINPRIRALCVSARSGEGMKAWLAWLEAGVGIAAATPVRSNGGVVASPDGA